MQNYLDLLYKIVRHRVFQIECEISLLKGQYSFMSTLPKINPDSLNIFQPKISILGAVSTMYKCYLKEIERFIKQYSTCPFKRAIQCHLWIVRTLFLEEDPMIQNPTELNQQSQTPITPEQQQRHKEIARLRIEIDRCKMEIEGHQDAIRNKLNTDYFDNCDSMEKLFEGLYYLFPYTEIINLLCSPTNHFFTNLFKFALDFKPTEESNLQCLRKIYGMLKDTLPTFNKPSILAISEILLGIFTFKIVDQQIEDNLKCFQFFECCNLLVKCNLAQISIKDEMISLIENNIGYSRDNDLQNNYIIYENEKTFDEDSLSLFEKEQYEYVDDKRSPIMCLHHIVLEFRKLPLQPSVSLTCFVLIRTLELLNSALSGNGEMVGADESFQFFVAALADARLYRLPTLLPHLERFLVPDLRFGKILFLISQLRCASEFILTRKLSVPPYLLFPFKLDNLNALKLVTNKEINSFGKEINHQNDSTELPNDSQALELPCFIVYAFPRFLRSKGQIPAVLFCNGDNRRRVRVYRYKLADVDNAVEMLNNDLGASFSTIGTVHGTLYYMPTRKDYEGLILLKNDHIDQNKELSQSESDSGASPNILKNETDQKVLNSQDICFCYNDHIKDICEFSNLLLMPPDNYLPVHQKVILNKYNDLQTSPQTHISFGGFCHYPELLVLSNLPKLETNFKKSWHRHIQMIGRMDTSKPQATENNVNADNEISENNSNTENYEATFPLIMALQKRLIECKRLPQDYEIAGCLDRETITALVRNNTVVDFELDQKIYSKLISQS